MMASSIKTIEENMFTQLIVHKVSFFVIEIEKQRVQGAN